MLLGNDDFADQGNTYAFTTMHWGPYFAENQFARTQSI